MKNLKTYNLITLLLALIIATSCVKDDNFDTPDLSITEPNIENVIDMNAITSQLVNNNLSNFFIDEYIDIFDDRNDILPVTFESTNNYIQGYVISNDEAGNFFEEIVIQDSLENPTYGINILVDVNPLFTRFQFGQKVFIKLDDLSYSISSGVLTLGLLNSNTRLEKIPESKIGEFIIPSNEIGVVVPKLIDISDPEVLVLETNQFVTIENVQFNRNLIFPTPQTFANADTDEFDGERLLESCVDGSIIVSTSTFSDFKSLRLPANKGVINGVLTRNFFGDTMNLVVNSPSDINFDDTDRCDPLVFNYDFNDLNCTNANSGSTVIYSEDFESFSDDLNPWATINLSGGDTNWVLGNFSGSNYAQISGFSSDEPEINVFLVSESFDLDATTDEKLNFDIQVSFDAGNILDVLISNDYVDDVYAATWSNLNANIPSGPSGGFGTFETVDTIDISCIDGNNVTLAFLYKGEDPGPTTRYHVDNIVVTGN